MVQAGEFTNEKYADFSSEENARAMMDALARADAQRGANYPLVVGGKRLEGVGTVRSLNPAHAAQVLGTVSLAGPDEARAALQTARAAFPAWRDTPASKRAAILRKAAELMRARRFDLDAVLVLEAGKNWREADADLCEAIDFLEYYAREMTRLQQPQLLRDDQEERDSYFYDPRGVAVVIAPWNFPLAIAAGMASAALVAGNTVIFKPAGPTSVIGAMMVDLLHEAGIPPEALSFLPCVGSEVGSLLVQDPLVDVIAFTGSMDVGLSIIQQAAPVRPGQRNIKKVIAELGGKNAVIVDDEADVAAAVSGVVRSAFGYGGQKCSACSRAIVVDAVYDEFLAGVIEETARLRVGDPATPGTDIGPVISEGARAGILEFVAAARPQARQVFPAEADGSAEGDRDGYYVEPHIFVDVPVDSALAQDEVFGPVLAVFKVPDFDEALALAQNVRFGLTGGVYSRNPEKLQKAFREFRVGNLYTNRHITGALVGCQPFGGSRMSGVGSKAGGPDYLLQFLEPRVVTECLTDPAVGPIDVAIV